MKLNIRTKLAANQDTELISVDAYTVFEIDGHKFFSHHDVSKYVPNKSWKCSEYFTGLAITWGGYHTEDKAIEATKKILIERRTSMDNYIEKAIRQYGYANKED